MKTLTFFSNYFNHHQKALCDAFYALLGEGFTFVETMPMESFRSGMGWGEDCPSYVLKTYESDENEERAKILAASSDLVIMGTAPEYYIEPRLSDDRIIFRKTSEGRVHQVLYSETHKEIPSSSCQEQKEEHTYPRGERIYIMGLQKDV